MCDGHLTALTGSCLRRVATRSLWEGSQRWRRVRPCFLETPIRRVKNIKCQQHEVLLLKLIHKPVAFLIADGDFPVAIA